jgi:peptidoglycan/LPS O-acetylase OafA/YrhL
MITSMEVPGQPADRELLRSGPKSFDLLLIIRGLAALSVVVWHVEGYKATFPPLLNPPGRTAVWLFFGISGYVIAYGFIHQRYRLIPGDLKDFYLNRVLRIYPLFLCLSLLGWVTLWLVTGTNPLTVRDVPAQFFAFQFNQTYLLSGVFWTLGIELQFYLLAPLLVLPLLLKSRYQPLLALAVFAVMVYGIRFAVERYGWSFDGRNIVSNLPHFFAGMMGCRLVRGSRFGRSTSWLALAAACSVIGYSSWLYHRAPGQFWSVNGILLIDIAILLFIVAHAGLAEQRRVPARPIAAAFMWLGTLSYGVYAWHAYLQGNVPWVGARLWALVVVSVCAAYVSYRFIEVPALRLKRHPAAPATRRRTKSVPTRMSAI